MKIGLNILLCVIVIGSALRAFGEETAIREVSAGEEFTLKQGESVKLKDVDLTLTVTGFENSPCPEGSQCIWSGLAVNYDLTVGGFKYSSAGSTTDSEPIPADLPLEVLVKESDYKTYATMTMTSTATGDVKTADPADQGGGPGGVQIIETNGDPKDFTPEAKKLFIDSGTKNIPPPCPEGTHVEGEFCRKDSDKF